MRCNVLLRGIGAFLLVALMGAGLLSPTGARAQGPTPTAIAGLPEGPLGEQMQWLVDYINLPESEAAAVDLATIFTPGVLADVPADQLGQILNNIRTQLAPVTIDTATMVTTDNFPSTSGNFNLVGADGTLLPTTMSVDPTSGLISFIWFAAPIVPAATWTATATSTATATLAPTETSTATATAAPTETPTLVPTATATEVPTETATVQPAATATEIPSETPLPTETATLVPTATETPLPTETPTLVPTETATPVPTDTPTAAPTETPTLAPTETPTLEPTETATLEPTETATLEPTQTETLVPTETPTPAPTETATPEPTETPTLAPTETATLAPTDTPTLEPTETETLEPTETPTLEPTETATSEPTETQTLVPTETPTLAPTETETLEPTETATLAPTETATLEPTETATLEPTETATVEPAQTLASTPTEAVIPAASPAETIEAASPVVTEEPAGIASPAAPTAASPTASEFAPGPLGEQAAWTWAVLSNSATPVTASEIEAHVAPALLAQVPAAQAAAGIEQIKQQYGPFTLDQSSIIVTANEPPTNLGYVITGQNGTQFRVSLSVDPESGLLTSFLISPAGAAGTPVAVALPAGMSDTKVSFTSGGDTIYGSFLAPDGLTASDSLPAALIISGSGPTDRNGNSGGLSMNTNLNLAITLAQAGIPSLRYDKLGSGETGLGTHADGAGIDYELFRQEAHDAAQFLSEQPGVDPSKLIIVGHSEGALFALVLAQELTDAGTPPAALILAAPLSVRYLDILHDQLTAQLKAAVTAQTMTQDGADKITAELEGIIESLRTNGTLPATIDSPELAQLFSPGNAAFLAQIDKIDPSEVAAGLPSDMPVLVLLGFKDAQVTGNQVRHLMDGFREAGNDNAQLALLPKADHTLRIIEGTADPSVDYANPDLEFSPQAVEEIDAFLEKHGLSRSA